MILKFVTKVFIYYKDYRRMTNKLIIKLIIDLSNQLSI